jgi:hypothetical protein
MSKVTLEPTGIVEYYSFEANNIEGVLTVTKDMTTGIFSLEYHFDPDDIPADIKEDIKKAYRDMALTMKEEDQK